MRQETGTGSAASQSADLLAIEAVRTARGVRTDVLAGAVAAEARRADAPPIKDTSSKVTRKFPKAQIEPAPRGEATTVRPRRRPESDNRTAGARTRETNGEVPTRVIRRGGR